MINEEPTNLETVLASLMEFSNNCVPDRFTVLLSSVEVLRSIVTNINRLEDEDEQEIAVGAFSDANHHFDLVVWKAHSMHLLEEEGGAQTEAAQLARALATPARRGNFLVAIGGLCQAALCGDALRRNRDSLVVWSRAISLANTHPAVAPFAPPIDPDELMSKHASDVEATYKEWEVQGFRIIDLESPLLRLQIHAGALWLKLLQDGPDKAVIEQTRQLLHRSLYFLKAPSDERWTLRPYSLIGPTDNLRAILNELLRHDLEPMPRGNDSTASLMEEIFPNNPPPYQLTEGRLRKRRYVILFPRSLYFITEPDELILRAAAEHPVKFIRDHLEDMPRSLGVLEVERRLVGIENLQNDENLATWAKTVAVGMTANAIAAAVCNSLQLPSEARAFITVFASSLVLLVRPDRH